jgi:hypothetical protein
MRDLAKKLLQLVASLLGRSGMLGDFLSLPSQQQRQIGDQREGEEAEKPAT